jgi:hypothetical protein
MEHTTDQSRSSSKVKVKYSPYRPGQSQRVDRGTALSCLDLGARRGEWSAPHPGRFNPGKHPVPNIHEAGWAPGPVWTCAKNLAPTGIRSRDRPARSQSLYRLTYPARRPSITKVKKNGFTPTTILCASGRTLPVYINRIF